MGELIFNLILAVVAVVMFIATYSFPASIIDKSGGAGMFPRIVIIFLLGFLLIRTVQILKSKEEKEREFVFLDMFRGPKLVYLLTTLAYFLSVKYVGFIITSILYLSGMTIYLYRQQTDKLPSRKKTIIIILAVVAGVVLLDYLFCEVLNVLLPAGILGF